MKVGIARLFTKNCDLKYNFEVIEKLYKEAINRELEIIIFPRLAITGFSVNDAFGDSNFLEESLKYVEKLLDLTMGEKTKVLIGSIYYEKDYEENNNIYEEIEKDSVLFIDNGYIDTVIFRKEIDKRNILEDYKYFDKGNFLKQFEYKKKKFSVLLSDDIFSNFNVFLTTDSKPDYVICLDSSSKNMEERKKHLVKLAKFVNSPVFYVNNASELNGNLFRGEAILINEDFKIVYEDFYKDDEILEFDIDCEDGTELFLKNKLQENKSLYFLMKKIFGENEIVLDCENFEENELDDIVKRDKSCRLVSFKVNKRKGVENIDIYRYINSDLYEKFGKNEKRKFRANIVEIIGKKE